ncbi:UTP23 [Symbiodinium pilosum]|uniref:UTP23 protein n=1 Tax=Symbiodinium pilosum TaxID=2952 RepID=A0A812SA20_SYMPI|nr:UTP23 [Symbiodinium pilosum]
MVKCLSWRTQCANVLYEPSISTRHVAKEGEDKKRGPSEWEKPKLPELKAKEVLKQALAAKPKAKRKKRGVNPLSCKKSTKPKAGLVLPKAMPVAPKAKRVRSRRMGNRSREQAEMMLSARPASEALPVPEEPPASQQRKRRSR